MTEPINPVRLATIRNNHAHDRRKGFLLQADNRDLGDLLEEVDRLTAENERLRNALADGAPYVEAGKQLAAKQAESEYYHGTCDGCSCCTTAQCRENRCPTNSIGDSICPCTCE